MSQSIDKKKYLSELSQAHMNVDIVTKFSGLHDDINVHIAAFEKTRMNGECVKQKSNTAG
jgi:hypothetical protein